MASESNECSRLKRHVLGACALMLSAGSLNASEDTLALALEAYEKGLYNKAAILFEVGAEKGDVKAQHLLGAMYRTGVGVQRDEYRAFELCKIAADGGLLEAQFQLGLMYLQGEGVTQNDDKALKWIWAAADRDYPQAKDVLQFILSDDFGMGC